MCSSRSTATRPPWSRRWRCAADPRPRYRYSPPRCVAISPSPWLPGNGGCPPRPPRRRSVIRRGAVQIAARRRSRGEQGEGSAYDGQGAPGNKHINSRPGTALGRAADNIPDVISGHRPIYFGHNPERQCDADPADHYHHRAQHTQVRDQGHDGQDRNRQSGDDEHLDGVDVKGARIVYANIKPIVKGYRRGGADPRKLTGDQHKHRCAQRNGQA